MKVQIWSDIMCPFCYLGDKNLQNAIDEYQGSEEIEIEYKAFQLHPTQPIVENPENPISFSMKNGYPESIVRNSFSSIENEARKLGLPIDIESAKVVNSLNALRLLKYAQEKGKLAGVKKDLYEGYLGYAKDLSKIETLLTIAEQNGLDTNEVKDLLTGDQEIEALEKDRDEGISKGLRGVPFFIIDDQYALSGNQPKEAFLKVFNDLDASKDQNGGICDIETGICS